MSEHSKKITSKELCALTGLTDRRHRQISELGFFPKPINSEWEFEPTIRGILRFYRESRERATGDLAAEKLAKLRTERMIAELKLETQRGQTVQLEEIRSHLANLAAKWDALMRMKLEVEAPMLLQGKSVAEMRVVLRKMASEIRTISNAGLDEWKPATQ